jgi:hypothetical protein
MPVTRLSNNRRQILLSLKQCQKHLPHLLTNPHRHQRSIVTEGTTLSFKCYPTGKTTFRIKCYAVIFNVPKWAKLKAQGKSVVKGKVKFNFGEFQCDAVIPSLSNPKTILEIKIYTDVQHSLMLEGLINNLPNPSIKVGLVTLYDFGTFYAKKSHLIQDILKNLKTKFQNRFDCFHIENGWSSEMARLFQFA